MPDLNPPSQAATSHALGVVACQDPLDRSSVHEINRQASEALATGHTVIVIDLGAVTRVDNETLCEICVTLRRLGGVNLRIVGADRRIRSVLELCAIDGLEFSPSIKRALRRPADLVQWLRLRSRHTSDRQGDLQRSPSRPLS